MMMLLVDLGQTAVGIPQNDRRHFQRQQKGRATDALAAADVSQETTSDSPRKNLLARPPALRWGPEGRPLSAGFYL